jgi:hypothetical protein
LLEHATGRRPDHEKNNHVQRTDEAEEEEELHQQMGLFGTAPRQVTGNFGGKATAAMGRP